MSDFEERHRRIGTRGITLTEEQMAGYRIKKIYNAVGDPCYMNREFAQDMFDNMNRSGEFCLLDMMKGDGIYKISLLTFYDAWSRNMFALVHFEHYKDSPELITLYN